MLPLVKNDPWLEPVVKQVDKRHDRYEERLRGIIARYGSLKTLPRHTSSWVSTTTNAATAGGTANGHQQHITSR